jgi:RNA polymerase sigma factor (sigma-70 family)
VTTVTVDPTPTDEEIAARVFAGDSDALGVLYDRYAHRVYDLALRVLRDPMAADDVVQATFVNAWKHLKKRKVEGNVRAWLMSIARNCSIDAVRSRNRLERLGSVPIATIEYAALAEAPGVDPAEMAQRQEVADLVWEAASSLTPAEYSLLDLHIRQGLDPDELANQLRARKGSVHVRLFRMRNSLRKSVIASLLWRHAGECAYVENLKAGAAGGAMSHAMRQKLMQHAETCDVCQASTSRFANPIEIFAGLIVLPMSEASRPAVWEAIIAAIALLAAGVAGGVSIATAISGGARDLVGWGERNLRRLLTGAATAAGAAIVGFLLVMIATGDDDEPPSEASVPAAASATARPTREPTPPGPTATSSPSSEQLPVRSSPGGTPDSQVAGVSRGPQAAQPAVQPSLPPPADPLPAALPTAAAPPTKVPAATQAPRSTQAPTSTPTRAPQPTSTAAMPTATPSATRTATPSPTATATPTATSATCEGLSATIVGTNGADVLQGTGGDDIIAGLGGDDLLRGHGGNDVLCGGAGDDQLLGDGGDDELFGENGADSLSGSHGNDMLDGGPGPDLCVTGPGIDSVTDCESPAVDP